MEKALKKIGVISGIISIFAIIILSCVYAKRIKDYFKVVKTKVLALSSRYIKRYKEMLNGEN